jgi:hypothetical protein
MTARPRRAAIDTAVVVLEPRTTSAQTSQKEG